MSMNSYLPFDYSLSTQKPRTVSDTSIPCPFCDPHLHIPDEQMIVNEEKFFLIKNKFPALSDSFQTVLIEDTKCGTNLSTYPKEHLISLLRFSFTQWFKLKATNKFRSVVLLKNHGFLSGSSISHSHMQIIGFNNHDYTEHLSEDLFEGLPIFQSSQVTCNLSLKPKSELFEYNIISDIDDLSTFPYEAFGDYLQAIIHYLLNGPSRTFTSFNLAFYHYKGKIIVKVFPRTVSTIFLLGYSFSQVPINLNKVVSEIQEHYPQNH